jgi:NAD(P)-dependent dehydrogenase (short-subunit alcohol dehydrogenase family)
VAEAAVYSGTKGAVDAITRGLAAELGPRKIRVNAIAPGTVATEGMYSGGIMGSDFEKTMVTGTPLGRIGQPDDIARIARRFPCLGRFRVAHGRATRGVGRLPVSNAASPDAGGFRLGCKYPVGVRIGRCGDVLHHPE